MSGILRLLYIIAVSPLGILMLLCWLALPINNKVGNWLGDTALNMFDLV